LHRSSSVAPPVSPATAPTRRALWSIRSRDWGSLRCSCSRRSPSARSRARSANPEGGYEPLLDDMLRPILGKCLTHGIRIVSNFGAANPPGAARHILAMARELGLSAPRIAVVHGDDLSG